MQIETPRHTHTYIWIFVMLVLILPIYIICVYIQMQAFYFFFLLFASFCALGILNCSLIAFIEFDGNLNFIYYLHIWLANAKIVKLININGLQLLSLVVFIVVMAACFPANERKQRLIRAGIIHAQQQKPTIQWEMSVKQQQCTKKKIIIWIKELKQNFYNKIKFIKSTYKKCTTTGYNNPME